MLMAEEAGTLPSRGKAQGCDLGGGLGTEVCAVCWEWSPLALGKPWVLVLLQGMAGCRTGLDVGGGGRAVREWLMPLGFQGGGD